MDRSHRGEQSPTNPDGDRGMNSAEVRRLLADRRIVLYKLPTFCGVTWQLKQRGDLDAKKEKCRRGKKQMIVTN